MRWYRVTEANASSKQQISPTLVRRACLWPATVSKYQDATLPAPWTRCRQLTLLRVLSDMRNQLPVQPLSS